MSCMLNRRPSEQPFWPPEQSSNSSLIYRFQSWLFILYWCNNFYENRSNTLAQRSSFLPSNELCKVFKVCTVIAQVLDIFICLQQFFNTSLNWLLIVKADQAADDAWICLLQQRLCSPTVLSWRSKTWTIQHISYSCHTAIVLMSTPYL